MSTYYLSQEILEAQIDVTRQARLSGLVVEALVRRPAVAAGHLSQATLEAQGATSSRAHLSQVVTEVLYYTSGPRISQLEAEAHVSTQPSAARASQVVMESLVTYVNRAVPRLSSLAFESSGEVHRQARLSHLGFEVSGEVFRAARMSQVVFEALVDNVPHPFYRLSQMVMEVSYVRRLDGSFERDCIHPAAFTADCPTPVVWSISAPVVTDVAGTSPATSGFTITSPAVAATDETQPPVGFYL